ncbi:hypothetical protein HHKILHMN_00063 [Vibrio phage vB_VpaS_PGA]|nr:hypothetical protein HHKILHMN_00063 [Vibrio phage vB_VpaS_PGA]
MYFSRSRIETPPATARTGALVLTESSSLFTHLSSSVSSRCWIASLVNDIFYFSLFKFGLSPDLSGDQWLLVNATDFSTGTVFLSLKIKLTMVVFFRGIDSKFAAFSDKESSISNVFFELLTALGRVAGG